MAEPRFFGVDADYVNLGCFFSSDFSVAEQTAVRELNRQYKALYQEAYTELAKCESPAQSASNFSDVRLRDLPDASPEPIYPARRFLHAISCEGEIWLEDEIEKLASQRTFIPSGELLSLSQALERRRLPAIRCPSPLDPLRLEALILPWADRAFLVPQAPLATESALEKLREAKALHDQLEALYRPHMDFDALTLYTENVIQNLFP